MCVLFYFSFVCLHVYVYALESKLHRGSALGQCAVKPYYYCAPRVCVPDVIGGLAVWWHNNLEN